MTRGRQTVAQLARQLEQERAAVRALLAAIRAAGVCPCSIEDLELDDIGPHIPSCPWNDPAYGGEPFAPEARS